jgi:Brp/Blh family beta-carotene 15,15'-monooxygenase
MTIEALIASFGLVNLLALGGVVLIGLPHGAFDGAIAACLGQANRPVAMIRFIILYVALTGLIVGLWLVFPVASLVGFLGISIVHFGLGDARAGTGWFRYVQAVAHGGVVVAGISQSHRLEVDVIFGYLIEGDAAPVWMAIDVASVMIAVALAIYAWRASWDARWRFGFLEAGLLILLFAAVPPLVGFALYFCCIHSARHLWSVWTAVKVEFPRHKLFTGAMAFTLASWGAGAAAFWWCASFMMVESALLRVVFIGLAALTVPHMILVDGFFRANVGNSQRG